MLWILRNNIMLRNGDVTMLQGQKRDGVGRPSGPHTDLENIDEIADEDVSNERVAIADYMRKGSSEPRVVAVQDLRKEFKVNQGKRKKFGKKTEKCESPCEDQAKAEIESCLL